MFSSASDAPRARRPTDAVLLILGVLGVVVLGFIAPGPHRFDDAMARFVEALPGLFGWFWEISYDLLVGWAAFVVLATLVSRRRKRVALEEILSGALAFGAASVAGILATAGWSDIVRSFSSSGPPPVYPAVRFAVSVAVVVAASPHLSRPLRYMGRWIVAVGSVAAIALGIALPIGIAGGLAIGTAAAAVVHLIFGSPGGRLSPDLVGAALHDLGVDTAEIRGATLQARGAQISTAIATDGRPLIVEVYGRDAWDGQFLASIWSRLWYRDEGSSLGRSRMQQVEHEAFLTMLAERAGVPVFPVIAAGMATGRDALLVLEDRGDVLAQRTEEQVEDAYFRSAWHVLATLHATGMAHGRIDDARLAVLSDGTAALVDFAGARVAAPESFQLADGAQLLVTSTLAVGQERAVAVAARAIGAEGLAAVLPFIQGPTLTPRTRRAVRERRVDLDELRALAAKAAGVDVPKLEQLTRVTWGSVLMVVLILLVAYALISAVSDVGLKKLLDELGSASGPWLWIALALAPVVLLPQAFAVMGATERPVAFVPLVALESAIQFIQLAVPSTAARIALNVRFFQRVGATTTGAVAVGMIDSVAGFCVQAALLLLITLSGLGSLNLKANGSSGSLDWTLVILLVVVVAIAVAVALAVPRVRALVRARAADSRTALRVLHSPSKVAMLFSGNLIAQLLLAVILGLCLRAFGYRVPFADLVLVNTVVTLFAGFMPVPGGIGVAEAAYTGTLVALGIPHTTALATAMTMRVMTYYLPPAWGAFAMRWLRSRSYL